MLEQAKKQTENYRMPDDSGHFGPYGGMFVAETLMGPLKELREAYEKYLVDPDFQAELDFELQQYVGRPSPLYYAERWSQTLGGARIYLKREDLNHTGAHKINHCLGEALLAKHMGKTKVLAETGAGQHGVATATACAKFGMECVIYMGEEDMRRQKPNVTRIRLMGARVVPATSGDRTLTAAVDEAKRCLRCDVCEGCGLCHLACEEIGVGALHLEATIQGRASCVDFTRTADKCIGCGQCYIVCQDAAGQAIEWDAENRRPNVIEDKCLSCMLCKFVCPVPDLISHKEMPKGWKRQETAVMDSSLEKDIKYEPFTKEGPNECVI